MKNKKISRIEKIVGGVFVAAAMIIQYRLMGSAIIGINIGLMIAYVLWISETYYNHETKRVSLFCIIAIAVQSAHFCEEYLTGFYIDFPGLFGYRWSEELFVTFNIIWLILFGLAAWGIYHRIEIAYLPIWFLAIVGGIGNGILHPILSLNRGGYFSGLITSLASLIIGALLTRELTRTKAFKTTKTQRTQRSD